ncbi:MAG: AtpZ/AtpI family protein [Ilumatobacter sp.]
MNSQDSLGHGMDAVIMLVLFLGIGYGLDWLAGTQPIFMIVMTVIGAVGLFARFYYQYAEKMDQHDQDRLAKLAGPAYRSGTSDRAEAVDMNGEAA